MILLDLLQKHISWQVVPKLFPKPCVWNEIFYKTSLWKPLTICLSLNASKAWKVHKFKSSNKEMN